MVNNTDIVNGFLNGRDPMERIISIECGYNEEQVSIIYVNSNNEKRVKIRINCPYCNYFNYYWIINFFCKPSCFVF